MAVFTIIIRNGTGLEYFVSKVLDFQCQKYMRYTELLQVLNIAINFHSSILFLMSASCPLFSNGCALNFFVKIQSRQAYESYLYSIGPELQQQYLIVCILYTISHLNSYFSQNILARSNEGGQHALLMGKTVLTGFQPENRKERNRLKKISEWENSLKCVLMKFGMKMYTGFVQL